MNCSICVNRISFLFGQNIADGVICSSCRKKFPTVLKTSDYDLSDVLAFISYEEELGQKFSVTSRLWRMYIDERHNIIGYSKSGKEEPDCRTNFFRLQDVSDISLSMSDPIVKENNVYCDVILSVSLTYPVNSSFSVPIKNQSKCKYEKREGQSVDIFEPAELSLVRNILLQMAEDTSVRLKEHLEEIEMQANAIRNFEKRSAMSLFMLEEGYSQDELKTVISSS